MAVVLGTAPSAVKAALEMLGESIGPCRSPVAPLTPANQLKLRAALAGAGLLKA
jgi:dihydrodipicolinate synthase/N-acetylneuraminate lyase